MKWSSPQCASALITLFSGIILCYIAYFLSESKDVPDGALWYFGQTVAYAGGIFGIKVYADSKFIKFKEDMRRGVKNESE